MGTLPAINQRFVASPQHMVTKELPNMGANMSWAYTKTDAWAAKTQGGSWTQIAPIPPLKPQQMTSLRPNRPSSASSVSRLARQAATHGSTGTMSPLAATCR